MAEGVGTGAEAGVSFAFVCPGCGERWGRLEGAAGPWSFVRHYCGCEHSAADVFAGDWARGLSARIVIPGSFIASPVNFFPPETLPGLFLTSPQLANREVTLWGKWIRT